VRANIKHFILFELFIVVAIFLLLSKGHYAEIGSDFDFYYNRLVYIQQNSVPVAQWFSSSLKISDANEISRVGTWVPSPFYSIIFLGPLLIHKSQLLFALQGVGIAFLSVYFVRLHLLSFYSAFGSKIINWILFVGTLYPPFLRDSLTSGPTAVCNLFLIAAFWYIKKPLVALFLFSFAAMTRSSFPIYWLAMFLSCVFASPNKIKLFCMITAPSLMVYIIFYRYFYSTYPGSGLAYIFVSGLNGMDVSDQFFVKILSRYYSVKNVSDVLHLQLSFADLILLLSTNLKLLYGAITIWIFKIMSMLGFMHLQHFVDTRDLWAQRVLTLLYFFLVFLPGFVLASLSLIVFNGRTNSFWLSGEKVIVSFGVIYILLHAFTIGVPRYGTAVSWIFVSFLLRFAAWMKSSNKQCNVDL
jgi:hypothetical protein